MSDANILQARRYTCHTCGEVIDDITWDKRWAHEAVCQPKVAEREAWAAEARRDAWEHATERAARYVVLAEQVHSMFLDMSYFDDDEAAKTYMDYVEARAVPEAYHDRVTHMVNVALWREAYKCHMSGQLIWPSADDDGGLLDAVHMLASRLAQSYGFVSGREDDEHYPTVEDEAKALRYGIPPAAVLKELFDWMGKEPPEEVTEAMVGLEELPWRPEEKSPTA